MTVMHVNAGALNIRATPAIENDNIVVTLPFGHPLNTTGEHDLKRWIPVEATLNGKHHKGFVNVGYLRKPLSNEKETVLASAAQSWASPHATYTAPQADKGFEKESPRHAKPAICDLIVSKTQDLVIARGLTQVWALNGDRKIIRYPLLEDGRLDDPKGVVTAVLRHLG
jgi:hypothetical protein